MASFEKGMETGLNILFSQTPKIIMIELSIYSFPYFALGSLIMSDLRLSFHLFSQEIFQPSNNV